VAFDEEGHRRVQPADRPGAGSDQVVVTLGQEAKHGNAILETDSLQSVVTQRDDRCRAGIVAVGLVAVVVVQEPDACRQPRRDVDDWLAGGDELLSEQRTCSGRTLDRPQPRRERSRPIQQVLTLLVVGREPQHREYALIAVKHRSSVRATVRIDPDDEHVFLLISVVCHGGQT
jgi:hypothetical protein